MNVEHNTHRTKLCLMFMMMMFFIHTRCADEMQSFNVIFFIKDFLESVTYKRNTRDKT